jgi:hypothetical protein
MDHLHPPSRRIRRRTYVLLFLTVVGLFAAACSSSSPKASPRSTFNPLASTTTSTIDPHALTLPDGFQQPDTRFVSIDPVTGKAQPVPPIPVVGGRATVEGTVVGPGGPVAGATVHIERWVGSQSGAIDVATDGAGHFGSGGLLGGHYEVRAWRQPDLSTATASTGYLVDGGVFDTTVTMQQHNATTIQLAASTGVIQTGVPFTALALVTKQQVDTTGVVQTVPVNGEAITLVLDAGMSMTGNADTKTGADGLARWTLTCQTAGNHSMTATTADGDGSVKLPPCQNSTTTTTTTPGPTVINLPIGQSFTLPDPGVYPAGVYQASRGDCSVTWQAWVGGAWQDGTSQGYFMTLPGPGRDFAAASGSPKHCTYQRIG